MSYFFSDQENLQYQNEGYLVRENQFSSREINKFRKAFEITVSKALEISSSGKEYFLDKKRFVDIDYLTLQYEPEPNDSFLKVIEPAHALNPDLDNIISDQRLTDPIKSILSIDNVSLWTDKLNLKRPKIGSGFGWHQDSPYWIHDSEDVDSLPNVYICLDDADISNGCFSVIKGSHKEGCLPGTFDSSQLGGFYTDKEYFNIEDSIDLEAPAGSLIFFNQHIVHGSKPNSSDQERRAYIVTYQPENRTMLKSGEVKNIQE